MTTFRLFQVTFSMVEIYSEQVRDLLKWDSFKASGGLQVKEHQSKGFNGRLCKMAGGCQGHND